MLTPQMEERLNKQINAEIQSAYKYLAMSAYCKCKSLNGFGHWLFVQAQEELLHGMKIYDYIVQQGGTIHLLPVKAAKADYASLGEVFKTALEAELEIGSLLDDLANFASSIKDNTTFTFLQWFLTEQVEEISVATEVLDKIKLVSESGEGKY
ncbi:MAG: ferritin, partial [bacterium]|nr:ferritin [bacterium]